MIENEKMLALAQCCSIGTVFGWILKGGFKKKIEFRAYQSSSSGNGVGIASKKLLELTAFWIYPRLIRLQC